MEQDNNLHFTDEQFDELIRESFQRQQIIDDINVSVTRQLQHSARRRRMQHWGRIVAFAFGLPLLLLLFGWLLWSTVCQEHTAYLTIFNSQVPVYACLLLPVAAMLYVTWRAIRNFSPEEV